MTNPERRPGGLSRIVAPDVQDRRLEDLWSLAGRRAVVTGGARGIGKAVAQRLLEAGSRVVIGDVNVAAARRVADESGHWSSASDATSRLEAMPVDVADAGSVKEFARSAADRMGGIDIWVNNAAIFPSGDLFSIDETEWDRVIDVNLKGTWLGSREAARWMLADQVRPQHGVIVNLEAMAAYRGRVHNSAYVASKHGVVGLTRALGAELGPHGIRVVGLAPTFTETEGVADRRENAGQAAGGVGGSEGVSEDVFDPTRPLDLEDSLRRHAPLGRNAVPDDIARAVVFCVSDAAALITGSSIFVDAGVLAP